ncbi:hypothetical protein B0H15DRAFT_1022332 [Mycena belliarum]|uniref:Uncharacterized protein n=1 Tax=Mycena belliarum TaxID=1033014 RepID=A0AAD6U348_9AGAR|nr:hypothetical protein B0H15DRAFT_1022332 [Mycena belliae]
MPLLYCSLLFHTDGPGNRPATRYAIHACGSQESGSRAAQTAPAALPTIEELPFFPSSFQLWAMRRTLRPVQHPIYLGPKSAILTLYKPYFPFHFDTPFTSSLSHECSSEDLVILTPPQYRLPQRWSGLTALDPFAKGEVRIVNRAQEALTSRSSSVNHRPPDADSPDTTPAIVEIPASFAVPFISTSTHYSDSIPGVCIIRNRSLPPTTPLYTLCASSPASQ